MNPISLKTNFARILLLSTALVISINTIAGALFCKSMVTKPLVFESTLSVASKLLRSCLLELSVVAFLVLRIFVSVLASENFLSKSSASNGQHCGEYRVIYHKNNGNRFFLSFEAKYPNPEIKKGKAGCFAVADFLLP
jgi:hypothetical protein